MSRVGPEKVKVGDVIVDSEYGPVKVLNIERKRSGRITYFWFDIGKQFGDRGNRKVQTWLSARFGMDELTILRFFCDDMRHLICEPYTVENLHWMAGELGIKRCWFHSHPEHPHYDIPKRRIEEIRARCTVISPRELLSKCIYARR